MFEEAEVPRDLVNLVVPQRGGLVATGERQEPFRLVDGGGLVVAAAAVFFCDLQAAGRPDSTIRSYGLDLLRWFRFLLCTCQASGCESVGSCWLSVTAFAAGPEPSQNLLADHGDHCYFFGGRAGERGGGTRERIDMGAPLRGHGRAIGRPGAPFTSTPERHDHAIHF
jgi:hypothetical protein